MPRRIGHLPLAAARPLAAATVLLALVQPGLGETGDHAPVRVEDLQVVDCLLPGKVRQLGRRSSYLTPRRPLRTTALDCQIRGGEYTAYDRADYRSALAVWKGTAESGDAQAQYYLGQIYEQGLGTEPDYPAAALWYGKAAEQGHSAARIALGFLHEQGLGVGRDLSAALNLYRRALGDREGGVEDLVVLGAAEAEALRAKEDELRRCLEEAESLRRRLQDAESGQGRDAAEIERLRSELARSESEARQARTDLARAAEREVAVHATASVPGAGLKTGRYFALVVGNSRYTRLASLDSPAQDARDLAAVLQSRYGFQVRLLVDATRYEIMTALNELREVVTERDNLLIFYSGHGRSDAERQQGWWLPVDAEPDSRANWILNRVLSDQLDAFPARHVLVIADSCYEGALTRSSIPILREGMSRERRAQYLEAMLQKRSRLTLTSGGDQPASGTGAGARSAFARGILEVLGSQSGLVEASQVYRELVARIDAPGRELPRPPLFAPMRWARHEGADFLFLPRKGSV